MFKRTVHKHTDWRSGPIQQPGAVSHRPGTPALRGETQGECWGMLAACQPIKITSSNFSERPFLRGKEGMIEEDTPCLPPASVHTCSYYMHAYHTHICTAHMRVHEDLNLNKRTRTLLFKDHRGESIRPQILQLILK